MAPTGRRILGAFYMCLLFFVFVFGVVYWGKPAGGWIIFSSKNNSSACFQSVLIRDISNHEEIFFIDSFRDFDFEFPSSYSSRNKLFLAGINERIIFFWMPFRNTNGIAFIPSNTNRWNGVLVYPRQFTICPHKIGRFSPVIISKYGTIYYCSWSKCRFFVIMIKNRTTISFPNMNTTNLYLWRKGECELVTHSLVSLFQGPELKTSYYNQEEGV